VWGPGNVEYLWNGPLATDWQGIRGPYLGSAENPFPSYAALVAGLPPGVPRREAYMLNEFAPLAPGVPGLVKWIDTGASWILAPEQILANYANADGSPILDATASALELTPGIFAEIWTSPVLPLWLLEGGYRSFFVEVNRANVAGNTALTTITASIRGSSATSSIYDNMLTYQQANSSAWRGPSILGTKFRKVGGNLVGVEGPNQLAMREGNKWVGTYVENNTRIRIGYTAGASSDLILIHSAVIKNGVC
jgi:hypothetical protein